MSSRKHSGLAWLLGLIIALGSMNPLGAGVAMAAAPPAKTSAPGYYRFMVGMFEVTALSDGTIDTPVDKLLLNTTPLKIRRGLADAFLKSPVETSVNAYLINTGGALVLIDTGAGTLFGPTLGKLVANLRASGYRPDQVDEIYLTHLHPDHVGGLMAADGIVFPNAIVRTDQEEAAYWLSQKNLDSAPAAAKDFFLGAVKSLAAYQKLGHFKPFRDGAELTPGIRSLPTHGHTVGHTSLSIESEGNVLIVWGDLVHVAALQFGDPSVAIAYDTDPTAAVAQRIRQLNDAATNGTLIAAEHIQFPGLGHVHRRNSGFEWVPINYSRNDDLQR